MTSLILTQLQHLYYNWCLHTHRCHVTYNTSGFERNENQVFSLTKHNVVHIRCNFPSRHR